jgi:drug/metabolite transporter superfamily protein YnfA
VAISGTRVVVGARYDDTGATDAGSAYVYDLAGATPTVPVLMLTNPSPAPDDRFGSSVAISGTRVVIGTPRDGTGAAEAGSAYVYDLASVSPIVPIVTLGSPTPAASGQFGYSVAISGTRVVVGANQDDTGTTYAGSAYVYDLASATPTVPVATLNNPSPAASDWFGYSVAVSGTRVVVGAILNDTGAADAGSAYVYDLASATPTVPVATLTNPSPAAGDWFGFPVALAGTRVVVGAILDDTGATDAGSAYVYDLASATPAVPVATLKKTSPTAIDHFGNSVAIDGTTIVVGASKDDTPAADRGAAYIFGPVPMLSIAPAGFGLATISWTPAMSSGFVLQCADGLAPAVWSNAPSGALNPVTLATTNAAKFYRLVQQ